MFKLPVLYSLLQLYAVVNASAVVRRDTLYQPLSTRCSVSDPPPAYHKSLRYFDEQERQSTALWNSTSVERLLLDPLKRLFDRETAIQVDTYIHVVSTNSSSQPGSEGYVSELQLINTFAYLGNSFNRTAINFNLKNITRTVNDTWAVNGDDLTMKTALRQGSYSSLNIYYQSKLDRSGSMLGFSTLPKDYANVTSSDFITDGCNILASTVAGGTETDFDEGATTVHEVGHFFGLLHTFEGNTCSKDSWGDYVSDTPQQRDATVGCPQYQDTCPVSGISITSSRVPGPQGYAGPDPVHNFMDYSTDACLTEFTPGQTARMLNMWEQYRKGR
ncbi:uncharacterized protein HMPREF1541_10575 [Cyphellophora europaea CBS 101466]|uniref:Peptidase M43 pregnancy-associated plasma-A domain-containing protein n=1 Tax=Cyphellophora europaea (strain CBS 101466) TaxID=1220924 RepID=W2S708_CYPE1|nr:uncharacterized protein HMPREF1541_10575 [Cyphellophora europaea CBS 101466]ETN44395.1 hypothetical protein HMPREF1541_10575 [Cyphellophora europaea CBS 101466]